jgi:hypothetical protein
LRRTASSGVAGGADCELTSGAGEGPDQIDDVAGRARHCGAGVLTARDEDAAVVEGESQAVSEKDGVSVLERCGPAGRRAGNFDRGCRRVRG